jgi:hypothetical protein
VGNRGVARDRRADDGDVGFAGDRASAVVGAVSVQGRVDDRDIPIEGEDRPAGAVGGAAVDGRVENGDIAVFVRVEATGVLFETIDRTNALAGDDIEGPRFQVAAPDPVLAGINADALSPMAQRGRWIISDHAADLLPASFPQVMANLEVHIALLPAGVGSRRPFR